MGFLSYNNYTGKLVFRRPGPYTPYNNPYAREGLSFGGECCCCCGDLCRGSGLAGRFACCCGLPNPNTGHTNFSASYSGTETSVYNSDCPPDSGYEDEGCTCYDFVYTSSLADVDRSDYPCSYPVNIHKTGTYKPGIPFTNLCCCTCDTLIEDFTFFSTLDCPTKQCPRNTVDTYYTCACSPTRLCGLFQLTLEESYSCSSENYRQHQLEEFYAGTCANICDFHREYERIITISYSITIFDPDNCCRTCINPDLRWNGTEYEYGYWNGNDNHLALTCGTYPCETCTESFTGPTCAVVCGD